ncbi:MAG: hypothetical protein V4665_04020 [Patescibacteria group bacterium]
MGDNSFLGGNKENKSEYSSKIQEWLQDYANNFIALQMHHNFSGIEGVRKIIAKHPIPAIEDYKKTSAHEPLTDEEAKNPELLKRLSELETLRKELSESESLPEDRFIVIMDEVSDIVRRKAS